MQVAAKESNDVQSDDCTPHEVVQIVLTVLSRSMGVTYCWGIPRGIVFGLGEVGDGIEGGRLRTRGLLAE